MIFVDATAGVPKAIGRPFDEALAALDSTERAVLLQLRSLALQWPVGSRMQELLFRQMHELLEIVNRQSAIRSIELSHARSRQE